MDHPQFPERAPREPVPPTKDDIHCVLSTGLIYLLPKFHGFAGECPHRHLEEFHNMCSSMKPSHVPLDHIFLRAFPHSLHGAAKDWQDSLPLGSVTNWGYLEHQFLSKFSPEQYGYINDPEWNDLNNEWYDTPQDNHLEPPFQSTFMPPPVQQYESQQYDAPAQIAPQPSTSEPALKELLEQRTMQSIQFKREIMELQQKTQAIIESSNNQIGQMATQHTEEQSQNSERPFQTVQIPDDDDNAIDIGDEEQSYELTTVQPTFPPSDVPTLAPEETDKNHEGQADMRNTSEPGRSPSSSHTLAIFKEVEVSIPQIDYSVDCTVDWYADNYIVAEHVFNSPSEHESESVFDNACNFKIDSCCEDISEVQYDNLGVIPLHVNTLEPHYTNPIAGGTYKLDEQTPTIEDKGASTQNCFNNNRHLLSQLINNHCLDLVVENISLLDQIWRMKQFVLNTSVLDHEVEDLSLMIQNWQLPP
ncbi:hypothetical protein LR48_Vigan642s000400 [Vigna angularis]|uniref:Retrotransposon gag domain-containing protein n=1 Tax=Phaseolus angularis TaxID=3914 RepID=A0A0L9TGS0_PHAAN|nr:hypothetical protein LR48_Vigan642s000400 [Vigna angularis]